MGITNSNPYIIVDVLTFEKMLEYLELGKTMSEKKFTHLTEDFDRVIKRAKEGAECFLGTQNKPNVNKAFKTNKK